MVKVEASRLLTTEAQSHRQHRANKADLMYRVFLSYGSAQHGPDRRMQIAENPEMARQGDRQTGTW